MKKKLFTLLTLAVTGIMGAWAQSTIPVSITWNLSDLQTNGIANPTEAVQGNATLTVGSGLSILESTKSYSNIDFMQFQPPTGSEKGDNSLASAKNLNKYIDFTFTPSAEFTMTKVEFDAIKIGTGDPQIFIEVIDGGSSITVAGATDIRKNEDSETNIHHSYNVNASASTNALTLRIYVGKLADNKQVGLANVVIEGNMIDTSAPLISASNVNINATENGVAATQTIDVTGDNLTGTTLTATLGEDAPEGLSITPANAEIQNGSINTSFTLSYTATENASGTTTLTFSDGETSKTVTVTYYAEVAEEWTLQDVTGAIKWDFSDIADGLTNGDDDVYGNNDFQVYANVAANKFKSTFDVTKLSGKASPSNHLLRVQYKCAQGATLKFHTTVPGVVKVTFSHTSGNGTGRYITVNDVQGTVEAVGTTKKDESFNVQAGDVIIDGSTQSVRIYTVEFTPITSDEIEITCEGGLASYTTTYPLDFTESDATAYIVKKADNAAAYLTEVKKVPAGIGIIVMGTKGEKVSVPVTSEETDDVNGNLLEGVTAAEGYTVSEEEPVYALSKTDGLLHPVTADTTIPQGKAYLPASALGEDVNPSRGISLVIGNGDDDGTTSITGVEAKKFIENNKFYNLNGQEVLNPTKGLYIVNGKKVIIK